MPLLIKKIPWHDFYCGLLQHNILNLKTGFMKKRFLAGILLMLLMNLSSCYVEVVGGHRHHHMWWYRHHHHMEHHMDHRG
jgi:hypothetical protein